MEHEERNGMEPKMGYQLGLVNFEGIHFNVGIQATWIIPTRSIIKLGRYVGIDR